MNFVQSLRPLEVHFDECISIGGILDTGATALVFEGVFNKNGIKQKVALKTSKSLLYFDNLKKEALYMTQLCHHNVVKLIAVTEDKPFIVLEYMELGNLSTAIKKCSLSKLELLKVLKDIAAGMEYIHSQDFIHRDLACRNVFLNSQKQGKIGDFGTIVFVGYTNGEHVDKSHVGSAPQECDNLPPEALEDGVFTKASDVWAAGILIWNIYDILGPSDRFMFAPIVFEIALFRIGKGRLEKPKYCPVSLWEFTSRYMLDRQRNNRVTFSVVKDKIKNIIQQKQY